MVQNERKYEIDIATLINLLDTNQFEIFDFYTITYNTKKQIQLKDLLIKNISINYDNNEIEFSFYKNASGALSLTIKNPFYKDGIVINNISSFYNGKNKIKLAIIGSCFSRQAFRSEKCYNPEYKNFYEVGLTFYHMSIPSIVSDPINFNERDFVNSENQKDLLKYGFDSFKKDCFDKLREYKPDYLILENYSSITNDLFEVDGLKYIDNNYYLKNTNAIKNLSNCRLISHCSKEFFEIFKKSVKKFVEKLKNIIDLHNVILIRSQPSLKKLENSQIVDWENQQLIKMRRYLWNKFDEYFISQIPECNVLDLRNDNKYYSEKTEYQEFQSNHLNQQYYKDELNEINKIILKSYLKLINNRR